jgi:hypothetical protein
VGDFQGHPFRGNQYTGGVQPKVDIVAPNKQKLARAAQAKMSVDDAQRRLHALGIDLPKDLKIIITDHASQAGYDFQGSTAIAGTSLDGKTILMNVGANIRSNITFDLTDKYWSHRADAQRALHGKGIHSTRDVDHAMIHEVGHALFKDNSRIGLLWSTETNIQLRAAAAASAKKVAGSVSKYAMENPHEFIAETFTRGVVTGNKDVSDDVVALYTNLGGPRPDVVFRGRSGR